MGKDLFGFRQSGRKRLVVLRRWEGEGLYHTEEKRQSLHLECGILRMNLCLTFDLVGPAKSYSIVPGSEWRT